MITSLEQCFKADEAMKHPNLIALCAAHNLIEKQKSTNAAFGTNLTNSCLKLVDESYPVTDYVKNIKSNMISTMKSIESDVQNAAIKFYSRRLRDLNSYRTYLEQEIAKARNEYNSLQGAMASAYSSGDQAAGDQIRSQLTAVANNLATLQNLLKICLGEIAKCNSNIAKYCALNAGASICASLGGV